MDREEKLPRWAKTELNRLRRNIESLEVKLSAINGDSETDVHIWKGLGLSPLPQKSTIRFQIGDNYNQYIDCCVIERDSRVGPMLEIRGGCAINIHPESANAVSIKTR